MSLNIKDESVTRLALQVATETRQSPTDAIAKPLEPHRQNRCVGLSDRLMELARYTASLAPADWFQRDFDLELYDERGLPK